MSFDLHFYSNDLGKIIEKSAFNEYFSERTHYELNGNQAFYSNETTGVYFYFEYSDSKGLDEEWDQFAEYNKILPVQFNLNMYRPHVFGLEAAGELSAFISNFNLGVYDPQEERKFDVYSQETFIQNWNKSNEFGYQAMLNQVDTEKNICTMPTDQSVSPQVYFQKKRIWSWLNGKSSKIF